MKVVIQAAGDSRLRVRGCDSADVRARLAEWFAHRPEVCHVCDRPRSATLDVVYRDHDVPGTLLRAARDHAYALGQPTPPRASKPARVAIAHAIGGRARLAVSGASGRALRRLSSWLSRQPGVVSAAPGAGSVVVHFEPGQNDANALVRAILASDPSEWPPAPPGHGRNAWPALLFDTAVLLAAKTGGLPTHALTAAIAITALPTARRTLRALRARRITVDLLDLTAVAVSTASGDPMTAALITWLLGLADLVLDQTRRRTHGALAGAIKLDVPSAWRVRADGQTERVATKKLRVGDHIVCDLGGRLPADGIVRSGSAMVDTKALTGESMPRLRQAGDNVMAASVVVDGSVIVEVRRVGRETAAGRIVQILENASEKPTRLQGESERIADQLVIPTLGLAGASALLAADVNRLISVLITDFGTGIRISAPTSTLVAMMMATRNGVLVKGGEFLERLSRADAVIFDKTGTVTIGTPQIVDVVPTDGFDPREAIGLAAAIESRQKHPVAEALRAYSEKEALTVPHATVSEQNYVIGKGMIARCGSRDVLVGGTRLMTSKGIDLGDAKATIERHERASISSLMIAIDGRLVTVLGYADALRPESRAVIRSLQARGRRRVVLMSGDASGPAEEIGRRLGVDEVFSELLPHEKADHVQRLQRSGRTVAMVGDGINDAPALALADVGISLSGSTDVALDAADVVLLSGGLSKLPDAFAIADQAMRSVRIGLGIVIVPNAVAIALGALGLIGPGVATLLNNGSTVVAALTALAPALRR